MRKASVKPHIHAKPVQSAEHLTKERSLSSLNIIYFKISDTFLIGHIVLLVIFFIITKYVKKACGIKD